MIIIMSPSKTMNYQKTEYLEDQPLIYPTKHQKVFSALKKLKKADIADAYKIKGDLIDKTYMNIMNYNQNPMYHAFPSFTGLVFFNLDKNAYQAKEYAYIAKHIRILDAFYGVLEPGTLIKPYRLDMKTKLSINLYKHWDVSEYFKKDIIINLASTEFSKMIKLPMININFLQNKDHKFINMATYSKQARGMFLDYLIKHNIEHIEEMKKFSKDNYTYNQALSDESNLTFTR